MTTLKILFSLSSKNLIFILLNIYKLERSIISRKLILTPIVLLKPQQGISRRKSGILSAITQTFQNINVIHFQEPLALLTELPPQNMADPPRTVAERGNKDIKSKYS